MAKKIAEIFNQLSRAQCAPTSQTDRQTTDRRICDSIIANVNASSRPLKMFDVSPLSIHWAVLEKMRDMF